LTVLQLFDLPRNPIAIFHHHYIAALRTRVTHQNQQEAKKPPRKGEHTHEIV
jgi:hypothetical protein